MDESSEKSELEALRERNIKEKNEFLSSIMNDPEFVNAVNGINLFNKEKNRDLTRPPPAKRRKQSDNTFKFTGLIPNERRKSARLENKRPDFTHFDLPDERKIASDSDSLDDIEKVVFKVKHRRKFPSRSVPVPIIPPEEVTEEMLNKVQTSGNKVYGTGPDATSCHQCRQKTIDTKTICRSGFCIGVRGQFCGICVINRYGEDPIKALKDPNWKCYVCRGCCNCSFCRLKQGKRPTGILAPLAKEHGFKSVHDFLKSLNGYGDYEKPEDDPDNLLGFDGNTALMGGNQKIHLKCDYDNFNILNTCH